MSTVKEEFVPKDRAVFQSDTAKSYYCAICRRWVFTQYEGESTPAIYCAPDGHLLVWP